MKIETMNKKRGQNTAEYILMLVLVAGAALGAFKVFGGLIFERFDTVMANMQGRQATKPDISIDAANIGTSWDINKAEDIGASATGN